jgi:hypothetical protein
MAPYRFYVADRTGVNSLKRVRKLSTSSMSNSAILRYWTVPTRYVLLATNEKTDLAYVRTYVQIHRTRTCTRQPILLDGCHRQPAGNLTLREREQQRSSKHSHHFSKIYFDRKFILIKKYHVGPVFNGFQHVKSIPLPISVLHYCLLII